MPGVRAWRTGLRPAGANVQFMVKDSKKYGGPDNERFSAGEWNVQDFVVVFRRDTIPMQRGNDCAVWERNYPFLSDGEINFGVTGLAAP
jgi:hypothetical protein